MNILTFDIEDWFHLLDVKATQNEADWAKYPSRIHQNMDIIFRILEEKQQPATFFCLGWVGKKYPEVIRQITDAGHEIATHSDLHQLAYEQSPAEFRSDLERSIRTLEDVSGQKIRAYRAPGFSFKHENRWVFEILAENGIEVDCSIFPAKRGHGGFEEFGSAKPCWIEIDGHKLKEFPINLKTFLGQNLIFSGGGYFRFIPKELLNSLFAGSKYTMTYFHPRDFDAGQPVVEGLSVIRRFKSYYGLKHTEEKLVSLLNCFDFIDLRTAEKQVDWQNSEVIKL